MRTNGIACVAAALGLLALGACNKGSASGEPSPTSENTTTTQGTTEAPDPNAGGAVGTAQAQEIFKSRCSTCHGMEGRGNGPGSITLNPKPRNYHDKDWQAKVTDEDIKKTIVYGGAAVGKSPIMPANPDLDPKPQVVEALVKIVRDFGKQ